MRQKKTEITGKIKIVKPIQDYLIVLGQKDMEDWIHYLKIHNEEELCSILRYAISFDGKLEYVSIYKGLIEFELTFDNFKKMTKFLESLDN